MHRSTPLTQARARAVFVVLAKTGLLQNGATGKPFQRVKKVPIADAVACGTTEPRVIEVLPAAVFHFGHYFSGRKPRWLADIIAGRYREEMIFGVRVSDCQRWIRTPTAQAYFDAW